MPAIHETRVSSPVLVINTLSSVYTARAFHLDQESRSHCDKGLLNMVRRNIIFTGFNRSIVLFVCLSVCLNIRILKETPKCGFKRQASSLRDILLIPFSKTSVWELKEHSQCPASFFFKLICVFYKIQFHCPCPAFLHC